MADSEPSSVFIRAIVRTQAGQDVAPESLVDVTDPRTTFAGLLDLLQGAPAAALKLWQWSGLAMQLLTMPMR